MSLSSFAISSGTGSMRSFGLFFVSFSAMLYLCPYFRKCFANTCCSFKILICGKHFWIVCNIQSCIHETLYHCIDARLLNVSVHAKVNYYFMNLTFHLFPDDKTCEICCRQALE